jgi:3D (Asp-Asp-Asp) domain-containing protein
LCSWLNEVTKKNIQKENMRNFINSIYSLDVKTNDAESINTVLENPFIEKCSDNSDNDISDVISNIQFESEKIKYFRLKHFAVGMSLIMLVILLKIDAFGNNYLAGSNTNNTKNDQQSIVQEIVSQTVSDKQNQIISVVEIPNKKAIDTSYAKTSRGSVEKTKVKSADIKKIDNKNGEILIMKATAYDLSIESCSKPRNHPMYGITFSGIKATKGRTVAVDPAVIPLGSRLYIKFPKAYSSLDGIYIAEDTGSKIKGNIIDIFLGEDKIGESIVHKEADNFGIRMVEVSLVN